MKPLIEGRRAWKVVLGCFVGLATAASPAYYSSFGVYLKPIAAETGWSRSALSVAVSLAALVAALALPLTGAAVDRVGPRRLILVACVLLPTVMASFYFLHSYVMLLALAVLMGIVAAPSSPLTYISLLPQWFDKRLGLGVSLAVCGLGLGSAVLPVASQDAIALFGWRHAWLAMATLVFVLGILNWAFLIRENPVHIAARTNPTQVIIDGVTLRQALRTTSFWQLTICFFLVATAVAGTGIHAVALLTDRGATPALAVRLMSLLGISTIGGRLITGVMLDRLSAAVPGVIFFGGLSLGLMLLVSNIGGGVDYVAMVLIGAGFGSEGDIMPYVIRRKFGLRAFGKIFGACFAVFQLGPVFGPVLMGLSFDHFGSYQPALILSAVMAAVAALLHGIATRDMTPHQHKSSDLG